MGGAEKRIAVFIPAYNEEKNIRPVLEAFRKAFDNGIVHSLCVGDDCSEDRTADIANEFGFHTLRHQKKLGKALNWAEGVRWAASDGADIFMMCDADMRGLSAQKISRVLKPMLEREDINMVRVGYMQGESLIGRSLCPLNVSGFRAIDMKYLRGILDRNQRWMHPLESGGYSLEPVIEARIPRYSRMALELSLKEGSHSSARPLQEELELRGNEYLAARFEDSEIVRSGIDWVISPLSKEQGIIGSIRYKGGEAVLFINNGSISSRRKTGIRFPAELDEGGGICRFKGVSVVDIQDLGVCSRSAGGGKHNIYKISSDQKKANATLSRRRIAAYAIRLERKSRRSDGQSIGFTLSLLENLNLLDDEIEFIREKLERRQIRSFRGKNKRIR